MSTSKRHVWYGGIAGAVICVIVVAWTYYTPPTTPPTVTEDRIVLFDNTSVRVEIADSDEERQRGLSGRQTLPEGTGMLFVMSVDGYPSVWMPDMYVALDILWLDSARKVVHIEKDVRPESYPATFRPDTPARYFLEVPAGFVEKNNIVLGDEMRFE